MKPTWKSVTLSILLAAVFVPAQTNRSGSMLVSQNPEPFCAPEREPDSMRARPARPVLSGPTFNRTRTHFKVHYTNQGIDSTTLNYAESTVVHAETSWARTGRLGWYRPPSDQTAGGDSLYDIYIWDNIDGSGVCQTDSDYTTPFPDGASTWIEIKPNRSYGSLRTLVAHEFHHGCQKRCTRRDRPPKWFNENTSVYMEDIIYPGLGNLYEYTRTYAVSPVTDTWRPLVDSFGRYEYAGGLWPKFLIEYYGPNILREIWELNGMHPGNHLLSDIDSLLKRDYFSSLSAACGHYAIWRYFTGTRDDEMHFVEAESIGTADLYAVHTFYPANGTSGDSGIYGPGGTRLIQFRFINNRRLTIDFNGQNLYSWRAYVLLKHEGIVYEQSMLLDFLGDGSIEVPPGYADTVVLIPVATGWLGDTASTPKLSFTYSATASFDNPVEEETFLKPYFLASSGPNPTIDHAQILWQLPLGITGTIKIYDATGRLLKNKLLTGTGIPGIFIWDLTDEVGIHAASGIYFCQLKSGVFSQPIKIIVK